MEGDGAGGEGASGGLVLRELGDQGMDGKPPMPRSETSHFHVLKQHF